MEMSTERFVGIISLSRSDLRKYYTRASDRSLSHLQLHRVVGWKEPKGNASVGKNVKSMTATGSQSRLPSQLWKRRSFRARERS